MIRTRNHRAERGKKITTDSGCFHNPSPSTARGARRRAKKLGQETPAWALPKSNKDFVPK